MKRNARTKLLLLLILIFSLLLVSCSHTDSGVVSDTSEKDTVRTLSTEELILPIYPAYSFPIYNMAIIEWGEDVFDLKSGDPPYEDYYPSKLDSYVGIGINYIKIFNGEAPVHPRKFDVFGEEIKKTVEDKYDDIVLMHPSAVNLIEAGTQVLIPEWTRDLTFGNNKNNTFTFWFIVGDSSYIDVVPIVDNKVSIPSSWYEENGLAKGTMNYAFTNTNDMLLKLGFEGKLFENGMTVDELGSYFDLVIKEETFAPLFEN